MNEQTSQVPPKPRKPLWRRILKWMLRVVVALAVLAVLGWAIWNYQASRELNAEIAGIRAAGQPLTFAQLDASWKKVEFPDDAGPFYAAAVDLLNRDDEIEQANRDGNYEINYEFWRAMQAGDAPPSEVVAQARKGVQENQLTLDMLDRGSAKSGCSYQLGIQYGIAAWLKPLGAARAVAKRNSVRTKLLALDGRGGQAVDSLVAGLRMGRMFDRQPVLVGHLVRIAILSLTAQDVPLVLDRGGLAEADLEKLEKALLDAERQVAWKRMLIGERVYAMELSRNLIAGPRELTAEDLTAPSLPERLPSGINSPVTKTMLAHLLRFYSELIAATDNEWPQGLDAVTAVSQRRQPSVLDSFSQVTMPSLARALVITGRTLATLRASRLAVMIERYRLKTGRLPESLEELQRATAQLLPDDPFTGKAMVFKKTAEGYMVFSLGEDKNAYPDKPLNQGDHCNWGIPVRVPPQPGTWPGNRRQPEAAARAVQIG